MNSIIVTSGLLSLSALGFSIGLLRLIKRESNRDKRIVINFAPAKEIDTASEKASVEKQRSKESKFNPKFDEEQTIIKEGQSDSKEIDIDSEKASEEKQSSKKSEYNRTGSRVGVRTALILSGGGFKGAFQLGAIEELIERKVVAVDEKGNPKFDLIAGISAGSINGALIAAGRYEQLKDYWEELKDNPRIIYNSDFIDKEGKFKLQWKLLVKRFIGSRFEAWFNLTFTTKKLIKKLKQQYAKFLSIADYSPLYERLKREVTLERIRNTGTHFICGCCSLKDGGYHCIGVDQVSTDEDLIKAIFASAVMPIIWEPVDAITYNKEGQSVTARHLIDGSLRNSSPIGDVLKTIEAINAKDENADEVEWRIIIINNNSGNFELNEDPLSLHYIASRSLIEITLSEIFKNDVDTFRAINELVKVSGKKELKIELEDLHSNEKKEHTYRYYKNLIIQPKKEELGKLLDTSEEVINARIKYGKKYVEDALDKSPELWRSAVIA